MQKILPLIFLSLILISCSNKPSSSLKKEQFDLVNNNVKYFLGEDYEAINFNIIEEGYTDESKTKYQIRFTFDLNKPFMFFDGKNIPALLIFEKRENKWECTFNSANAREFFNFLR